MNGRFSASKLKVRISGPGQLLPLTRLERETFKGPLHSETCRRSNSTYSAKPASGHWVILCLIGIGKLPFGYEP